MSRPATPADVDRICASLPETELGTSWGDVPTWKVPTGEKGKGFVLYRRPHQTAINPKTGQMYDDLLVLRCSASDKQALVEGDGPFFTIDHFRNYNAVLVQLSRLTEIDDDELTEVITEAWRAVAPQRLVKQFHGD
ncbi:MAG TPA: MmcQ/YjbR family DNA-binding protein [Marmoricola sp.]|nr:MmcQ/YjbR family DNA-binding protein [Marmoricola sp.]